MKILKFLIYLIGTLVIIFFAIGVINPSVKYSHNITIEAPMDKTWAVFSDETQMQHWIPNFKSIELVSGKKNALGSKYRMVVEDGGEDYELVETIIAWEKHYKFGMQIENDVLVNEVESIFTHINGRTKINTTVDIKGKDLLMKSSLFLMKGHFEEQSDESYEKLKSLVESQ